MRRFITTALAVCLAVFTTGCFEIEQDINLQKDMSGTANLKIGIDFEPMIVIMAQIGREMEGKKGPVTKAEIEKAKADFKKNAKKEQSGKPAAMTDDDRREIEKELPKGIKLLDFDVKESDFAIVSNFKFGFDKLKNLVEVKLPSKDEGGDPSKKNLIDNPFEGLEVIEKGQMLTIQTKPLNPSEEVKKETQDGGPPVDDDTKKMMEDAFKNLRVAYKINAPFEIVSHNATRKEGNTLVWEYKMKDFERMEKEGAKDFGVKVTYRK